MIHHFGGSSGDKQQATTAAKQFSPPLQNMEQPIVSDAPLLYTALIPIPSEARHASEKKPPKYDDRNPGKQALTD
jgi:hypothetical protein